MSNVNDTGGSVAPRKSMFNVTASQWLTVANWLLVGPLGIYYKALAMKYGLPVPDAGTLSSILMQVVPMAVGGGIELWRRLESRIVAEVARILAARQAPVTAAVVAQAASDIKETGTTSSVVRSHWIIALIALIAFVPLGGCMWTDSNGNQVVLTVQNATPLVVDKIKQICVAYNANKVTIDALNQVAIKAINNETATGVAKTVTDIATAACPLLEAMIKTTTAPAPSGGG